MNLYLTGTLTGYRNFNKSAFKHVEACLEDRGHSVSSLWDAAQASGLCDLGGGERDVFSPREVAWIFEKSLPSIERAHGIVLLKGWEDSVSANLDLFLGVSLGKDRYKYGAGLRRSSLLPSAYIINCHLLDVSGSAQAHI